MIDRRALGEPGDVVIEDDADLPLLRQWAAAAKELNAGSLAPQDPPYDNPSP